ncbi:MAG: hypothetical protein ACOCW8_01995 [bacterium]
MKTKMLFAVFTAMIFSSSILYGGNVLGTKKIAAESSTNFRKALQEQLVLVSGKNKHCIESSAYVEFKILPSEEIILQLVKTDDRLLENYVRQAFERLKYKDIPGLRAGHFSLVVNFETR